MPLDAICLGAVARELDAALEGTRIEKVYQPERDEIVLQLRGRAGARRLLITANANAPRVHFISSMRENPASPPMFCMLLRKHIGGAKIQSVSQPILDRVIEIALQTTDEMGMQSSKYLVCELMGRYSNLILRDEEGRVIDAIRRIDGDISGKRQVLPGLFYRLPPAQDKKNPFTLSGTGIAAAVRNEEGAVTLDKFLLQHIAGVSPLLCREIAFRATGDAAKPVRECTEADLQSLAGVFEQFFEYASSVRVAPMLLRKKADGAMFDFSFLPITQYGNQVSLTQLDGFSELLEQFYNKRDKEERIARKSQELQRFLVTLSERLERKLAVQKKELDDTKNRDQYKRQGDLITANFHKLEKGMRTATVTDYYDEACPEVSISLDVMLSPQQNAEKQFKKYMKAKTAETMLTQQIAETQADLEYIETVLEAVAQAENEQDLTQIREELTQTGFLSRKQTKHKKTLKKNTAAKPFHYKTADGYDVFAGKNNIQNDLLTLKTALKTDIWLHTQKIHGSHVILVSEGDGVSDDAIVQAAKIAAFHSKAKHAGTVPVDYARVRYVKKPSGAKPGKVTYTDYKTVYVTPDEVEIEKMRIE